MDKEKTSKRMTGGSAAERGLDFQARVSAIVIAHLLTERPMGWLQGVLDDTPIELHAETGGPGDDIRFSTKQGKQVELQAKRGLQRGHELWNALLELSRGISDGTIDAGVLAVCPNCSGTIREALAEDIVRMGTGRTDGLREIGQAWLEILSSASLDPILACRQLRIVVISAIDGNREAETTAGERLGRIVQDSEVAWPVLVEYGRRLIRRRERSTPEEIYRTLSLAHIKLKTTDVDTRVQLVAATRQWLHRTYANLTILGVNGAVDFNSCWLELDAQAMENALTAQEDLETALRRYHTYGNRSGEPSFDSSTISRFVKKCVVVGGPGMGKSTLLKKLALDYSADGFLTLCVRLPQVVALMTREGRRFEESLIEVALSGSGVRPPVVSLEGAVILCDALDECGSQQPLVTANLHAFSVAHPRTRVVVTSRPIGYRPGELVEWRHYELQPLNDTAAAAAVTKVLDAIPHTDAELRSRAAKQATDYLSLKAIKGAASRSPLMITLVAALATKGIDLGLGKANLYRTLFQLLQDHPPPRLTEHLPSEPERNRFLEMLGWCLLYQGNQPAEQILSLCARWWHDEMGKSFLASETKISECLEYWESLGVVERVRTHTQEAITFVHKTFGEFAASRYMLKCSPNVQREIIARAIGTNDWKEALSFASHLGLTPLILQVWAELADRGESKASNSLDDAVELVLQAGAPLTNDALEGFAQCCWRAVDNTASRVRYVAGEALCLLSQSNWSVIREEAVARLDSSNGWSQVVAWACLCISTDQGLATPVIAEVLPRLVHSRPKDSCLNGHLFGPTGLPVWQHLVLGAARRILTTTPDAKAVQGLHELIGDPQSLSVSAAEELRALFELAEIDLDWSSDEKWRKNVARLIGDRSDWNREAVYLLELIDDPLVENDDADDTVSSKSHELGAFMTVTSYWQTPAGDDPSMSASVPVDAARRQVIRALASDTGLEKSRLVRQARMMKRKILEAHEDEGFKLFELPKVDAKPELVRPLAKSENIRELEELILGSSHFFAFNAAQVLYSMHKCSEYPESISRLLTRGRGESLRLSCALARVLPDEKEQRLLLDRLLHEESSSGCRYLYRSLTAPYGAEHLDAVRKALMGSSVPAAKAAAGLLSEFSSEQISVGELRAFFEQWRVKEEPYSQESGGVPESPRDELAKILAPAFAQDHDFLLSLLGDDRSDVRRAGYEHALTEALSSAVLRSKIVEGVQNHSLEPGILRSAVSKGLYSGEEAVGIVQLLYSEDSRIRYAALPILDIKYLQPDLLRNEGNRLSMDTELDIREGANRALHSLGFSAPITQQV